MILSTVARDLPAKGPNVSRRPVLRTRQVVERSHHRGTDGRSGRAPVGKSPGFRQQRTRIRAVNGRCQEDPVATRVIISRLQLLRPLTHWRAEQRKMNSHSRHFHLNCLIVFPWKLCSFVRYLTANFPSPLKSSPEFRRQTNFFPFSSFQSFTNRINVT